MKIEIAVVLLVVAATFARVVPDYYPVADDIGKRAMLIKVAERNDGLAGELAAAFWRAEFKGHYRPMQDVVYVLCHHFAGDEGYGVPLSFIYLAMHCGSALLLMAILARLGMRRAPALLAGALFAAHPALDENIACIQFGNNVAGVFWVLAAAWLLLPARTRAGGVLRLLGAAVSIFTAIGFGINLAVTAAILSPVVLFLTLRERGATGTSAWSRMRPLAAPTIVGVAAALLAFWLRLDAYGTLKTKQTIYKDLVPNRNPARLWEEATGTLVRLEPATTRQVFAAQSPGGDRMDEFRRGILSVDGAGCLLVALAVAGAAVLLARRDERPQRLGRSALFGATLLVGGLLPYVYFIGRLGPNRYGYAGVPGLAVVALAVLAAVTAVFRGPRTRDVAVAVLCVPLIFCCTRTSREAARSIVAGQDVARTIVEGTIEAVRADPEVERIYPVGFPRVVGRAGYTLTFVSQLRAYARTRLHRFIPHAKNDLWSDLEDGRAHADDIGRETAILCYTGSGKLSRIRSVAELERTPGADRERLISLRHHWRLPPGTPGSVVKVLAGAGPGKTATILRILDELEGGERADYVRKALWRVFAPRIRKGVPGCPGLASPGSLGRALDLVREHGSRPVPRPIVNMCASLRHRSPELSAAVLAVIREEGDEERRHELAFSFALTASRESDVAAALALIGEASALASAVTAERGAIDAVLADAPDVEAATGHVKEARRGYAAAGVVRNTPGRFEVGCRLASLADADLAARASELARGGPPWQADLARTIRAGRRQTKVDLAVAAAAPAVAPGAVATFGVFVRNVSGPALQPRGASLADPWIGWKLKSAGTSEVLAEGAQPIPGPDLTPRSSRTIPLYVPVPEREGDCTLEIRLSAYGRELAATSAPIEVTR